ncbi:acetyl-CoA carboxylase biotin carboxyl carrier protein [Salimicrobium flavidum]|uniref:Biotin carboxyl carrier protein of acetyl-CoA carboxylase n=1 Tax=Salimicrobium flavidum TaxID=570947 RepID=A0A1N7IIM8_9BACI|nr:acetyl-CoA carboxylase biotin carboxyl carrier protein [Salimicrobium flavidum]SIS36935.1 biotin carboxyl carrier protein [Salimicrobium flavidum]
MLKVQEIRELIKLIDESSIQEFEYKEGESKVTLKKQGGAVPAPAPAPEVKPEVQKQPTQPPVPREEQNTVKEEKSDNKEESDQAEQNSTDYDYEIKSPMVGTVYHAPAPEDDPYIQVGDKVAEDSVVCIVEAMKLFNEIEAEVSGEVVEILVSDGELVEYNQPLFRVKR